MSAADTKTDNAAVHFDDATEAHKLGIDIDEVVAHRITDDDILKVSAECLDVKSKAGLRLTLIAVVMAFNQAGYGIDWSVIGGIYAFQRWPDYFHFDSAGVILGTVNGLMLIGNFCGAPFLALADVVGRRGVNFIGNLIVIVAALLQGLAPNLPAFMVGRFLLGFGTAMCSAPQYIAEVAPMHLRGRLVGIFGTCFQIGSVVMTGAMMGFAGWESDWQWRVPLILEGLCPFLVCALIYLCPESPRYLIMKNKKEEARKVIAKVMTTHEDVNAPIVPLMMEQIERSLETSAVSFRAAYDYRVFFTKGVRFRTLLLVIYSVFQQWNGGGIIGNYLPNALKTVGITNPVDVLGINLGSTLVYFVFMGVGAFLLDIFRRRTLIFAGLTSFILFQIAATITGWQYALHETKTTASLTVVWIYLFQVCSASFIANMHNLYPVELLSLPLRSKGMGLYAMIQGIAGVVQSYGISVGINKLGYKIWVVYIVYNCIQLVIAYFVFPETSKLSLEEIDSIFETPGTNPVKLSLKIVNAKEEKIRAEREGTVSAA